MSQYRVVEHFIDEKAASIRFLDSGGDDRGAPIVFVPGFTLCGRRLHRHPA